MMKRILALAVLWLMAFSGIPTTLAEEPTALTVGLTTRMSGYFFTEKWGTNTADLDIRKLIHGHEIISWELNGNYTLNETVLRKLDAFADDGDKRYRIAFNEGLAYSDGTPITARDYAFSALLLSSDEFGALGGTPTQLNYLKGYDEFRTDGVFSGVRVLDDYTLELTLDGRFLPYYYEIVWLNLIPYPAHVLAPGCVVKDDGRGAYIDGPFSEEILRETILDEETGYLFHPSVTSGPYRLLSFDLKSQVAKFERNPYYTGNFEGVIPAIEEITAVYADGAVLDRIEEGTLDLVNKVSQGGTIIDGIARMGEGRVSSVNYLRSGLNFLAFSCEMGPTRSVNVRKAVASCVDVQAVNDEFTQGFGVPVYGYYGMGQWMAQERLETLSRYETTMDLTRAIGLLQSDGWTLNEMGEPYDEESGGVRYRAGENGELEKLSLSWAQPEETEMSALLTEAMRSNLEAVGMEITVKRLPFDQLLGHYYRQTEREYHLFSLAMNFNLPFDPYYDYHTGEAYQGESNKSGLRDEELMRLAEDLRKTQVGDDEAYVEKWLAFQDRVSELQPIVPLFSNIYFDFFRTDLQGYNSNAYVSWSVAIVYAYIGEPSEAPDELESEEDIVFE